MLRVEPTRFTKARHFSWARGSIGAVSIDFQRARPHWWCASATEWYYPPGFRHFRRDLTDAWGSVISLNLHSFFYLIHGYCVTGALQRWLRACEEAFRSWSRLAGESLSKLLKCSIHPEMQPLSLLMIWPSLCFARDVFIERPATDLRKILKTWEKLLFWATISRRSVWSFQEIYFDDHLGRRAPAGYEPLS